MKFIIKNLIKKALSDKYDPLVTVNISKSALLHNLEEFRKIKPENSIAPVLKSNGYGHGLIEVANILKNENICCFVIDSFFEAHKLRASGIRTPLLIIGFVRPKIMKNSRLKNISFTVTSVDMLESIDFPIKIHLKIDTGMNRQGISINEIDTAINYLKKNKHIQLEGICSHLADADGNNSEYTDNQIKIWNSIVEKFEINFPHLKYIHLSNTFGHRYANQINANLSRLGIGLYGLADIPGLDLKPVLSMDTIITGIKKINKGEMIGYNHTFTASRDMLIATIPVGYYEGLDRSLSNIGLIKVKGRNCPIVGRISMNITTVDVTDVENVKMGDGVNVISNDQKDENSIKHMTELSQSISYELVVKIPAHLRREIRD